MAMKEAMETNRKEAGSDGKHGIEVKDNDYYSSSSVYYTTPVVQLRFLIAS